MQKRTVNAKKCLTYSTRDLKCASKSNPWYNCDCFTWKTMNSCLHFKISMSSFQTKLFSLCTRALRGNRSHWPFLTATRDIFHPYHLSCQHPHLWPARVSLNTQSQSPAPPSPDPRQNPLRCRRAQPGRVPALRRQPFLQCRSQHAAARASPCLFARWPPSSISIL